jgi:hypothetical protein
MQFLLDMEKIHLAIFRRGSVAPGGTNIGLFRHQLGRGLHQDKQGDHNPFYIARLGSLPTLLISGQHEEKYSRVDKSIRRSLVKLAEMNILKKVPLGDVIMAFTSFAATSNRGGTLHCSSPIPPGGAFSAIFRAWTINWGLRN